jgi:peptidoglycan/xylan/chitin deacetylase (PgdA/CDA1 family)
MYHSMVELEDRLNGSAGIAAAGAAFRRHMAFIRERLRPMSLTQLVETLSAGKPVPSNTVVVTFDDGYEDNYTHAFPALREFDIPATIFLATGAIGRSSTFWWDSVAAIVAATQKTELSLDELSRNLLPWPLHGTLSLRTPRQKQQATAHICSVFRVAKCGSNPASLQALRERLLVSSAPAMPAMLRWNQIEEMAEAGIEFGAHTVSHPDLTQLPLAAARGELEESKNDIEGRLGRKVATFAFPYGTASHWSPALESVARTVGFSGVVCAEPGSVNRASDPYWLPRISPARPLSQAVWSLCKVLQEDQTEPAGWRASPGGLSR